VHLNIHDGWTNSFNRGRDRPRVRVKQSGVARFGGRGA
jgi:hypothetical protein